MHRGNGSDESLIFDALVVIPKHVVHPDLLGGWGCKPNQSPKEEPHSTVHRTLQRGGPDP